jgi:phage tail sheath protein FI
MPEYLSPGVYVEEVSFRAKSLEGVSTSTTGFAGLAGYGPVWYPGGPRQCDPRLITSYTEFERVYGGLDAIQLGGSERTAYLAHAARAFFLNGGQRLYVSRVHVQATGGLTAGVPNYENCASATVPVGGGSATWRARWPGRLGNVFLRAEFVRSRLVPYLQDGVLQLKGPRAGAMVEAFPAGTAIADLPGGSSYAPDPTRFAVISLDPAGVQQFEGQGGALTINATDSVFQVELRVRVSVGADRLDVHDALGAHPAQTRYIGRILELQDPEDQDAVVWLDWTPPAGNFGAVELALALIGAASVRLTGGQDGDTPSASDYAGREADPDDETRKATGLEALGGVDDIAIVAVPDGGDQGGADASAAVADALIGHCERARYRIGVIDAPAGSSMNEIRDFRGRFDSKYAALYHPWIEILDPNERPGQGAPQRRLMLPPSGFVTGIYARSDVERGVHKAPANEVVRGLTRFEANINKGRQDVLNPEGVNCLRFFEGRGSRVWGARTISSDPEWKYVNVRRLFIYLEHTLDKGSQWAVFEPNNERLWTNVRRMLEDFLLVLWRDGALLGEKPEDAFFVRCDRTTMTQNDLDNGRMICLVGVAPVRPAEFVIFRVGQWTADAKQ